MGITINATTRQLYGSQYYSTNFAIVSLGVLPASMISALLSGMLPPDASAGYQGLFRSILCLAVVALAISIALFYTGKKRKGGERG